MARLRARVGSERAAALLQIAPIVDAMDDDGTVDLSGPYIEHIRNSGDILGELMLEVPDDDALAAYGDWAVAYLAKVEREKQPGSN
jgi:hypothetical protein